MNIIPLIIITLIGIFLMVIPQIVKHYKDKYGVHQRVEVSKFMEGHLNLLTNVKYKGRLVKTWCDTILSEDAEVFAEERYKEGKEFYKNFKKNKS